jgi:cytoskeletal protein CcmA (bactofilin family)
MALSRSPSHASKHDAAHSSEAVLGAGTRVRGRITGEGDLTILGHVEGEVHLRGELFIAEGGKVVSNVEATTLRVAGELEGDVNVSGEVAILAGAKVRGDVRGASFSLEEGADLDGRLDSEFSLPRELSGSADSADADGPTVRR